MAHFASRLPPCSCVAIHVPIANGHAISTKANDEAEEHREPMANALVLSLAVVTHVYSWRESALASSPLFIFE